MSLPVHLRVAALRYPRLASSTSITIAISYTTTSKPLSTSPPFSRTSLPLLDLHAYSSASSSSSRTTNKSTSKRSPSTLAKPDRFRPPSHPSGRAAALAAAARRRQRNPFADGPPLSEAERRAQQVKRYPNTFPQKGTVARSILTNQSFHMWFALV